MELLEQCQKWNENSEFQKIINILEAVPAGKRTPELDSELARAYNNLAQPWDRDSLKGHRLKQRAISCITVDQEGLERSGTSLAPTGAVHTQRTLHAVPIYGERPSCGSGVPDE